MSPLKTGLTALAALAVVPLAACSPEAEDEAAGERTTTSTLAATLAGEDELDTMSEALNASGLVSAFDGPGSYTILAPVDDAFAALGERGTALMEEEQKPILVAILRDHVLPGNMTTETIRQSIEQKGGPVEVRTMGEGTVTFSMEGDVIRARTDEGDEGAVLGDSTVASNGAVIAIDGLLKDLGGEGDAAASDEGDAAP